MQFNFASEPPASYAETFGGRPPTKLIYFNLLRLAGGQRTRYRLPDFETVAVPLSGACRISVDGQDLGEVGRRGSIWEARPSSAYAGAGSEVVLTASAEAEIAVAGGYCVAPTEPFRIEAEEVEEVDVGSAETHSRRRIYHILGPGSAGRTGNLLVSELYADGGCWSGYPPHKHDTDLGAEETAHEELYHWRFQSPQGFGAQLWYEKAGDRQAFVTKSGSTFAFASGYHPTVTAPGYPSYIFTILVGRTRKPLIQNFDPDHRDLMAAIPGITRMREKFR